MKPRLFVPFALLLFLACCSTGPQKVSLPEGDGPETYFQRFRDSLESGEWKYVHLLLSKRARNCYSRSKLQRFLTKTKPGILERSRLLYWNIERVEPGESKKEARLLLVHPRKKEFRRWYPMKLQDGVWRLDWSMADVLKVPRRVEDCQ